MFNKGFYIACLLLFGSTVYGQKWTRNHWGLQIGITADIGTHINQFGLKVQGYYFYDFFQFNVGNHLRLNSTNLGSRKQYLSQRINTGIALMGGKRNSNPILILDGLNHQSDHDYAIAYNYLWYFDNIGTSQQSGGFGFHLQQFMITIENDVFAASGRDRYRTSFASISYHDGLYNLSLNTQLWTGNTLGTKRLNTSDSLYQVGYKDLTETHFGRYSNGILSLSIDNQLPFGNHISTAVGIDSERIRHGLQNKFMHDKKFIPEKWRKANVNYPMLNVDGEPVHTKEEAAPARLFIQFGMNRPSTY